MWIVGFLRRQQPWLRFAYGLCAFLAAVGTILASPAILLGLTVFSAWGAASHVNPFNYIYNYAIRYAKGTEPLPKRGAPGRFACGLGTLWLIATAGAFYTGMMLTGYILGGLLVLVTVLVSTIHFCIPSLIYRSVFGFPSKTEEERKALCVKPGYCATGKNIRGQTLARNFVKCQELSPFFSLSKRSLRFQRSAATKDYPYGEKISRLL